MSGSVPQEAQIADLMTQVSELQAQVETLECQLAAARAQLAASHRALIGAGVPYRDAWVSDVIQEQ